MNFKSMVFGFFVAAVLGCGNASADWGNNGWGSSNGDFSANQYGRQSTLGSGKVAEGIVVQARRVAIDPSSTASWGGRAAGGAVGAAIGSSAVKKSGTGKTVAGILGGLVGAGVGDAIADATAPDGQEVIVQLKTGGNIVVTQAGSGLVEGQPVFVVETSSGGGWGYSSGGKVRVVPQEKYARGK